MNGENEMDKKLKRALEQAYRVPAPMKKAAFLKQYRRRELGRWELVAVQAGYVRWWIWGASLALFGLILWMAYPQARGLGAWYASALTPFLALLVVLENGRSRTYQMEELELACRMARHSVLLARMVVLGLFHLALLAGLTLPLAVWGGSGVIRTGIYLLTPYLSTAALGMELTRRIRGRECLPACGGAAVLVSGLGVLIVNRRLIDGLPEHFSLWVAALVLSAAAAGAEIMLSIQERSELQWN